MSKDKRLAISLGIAFVMVSAACGYLAAELRTSRENERYLSRMIYQTIRSGQITNLNTINHEKK